MRNNATDSRLPRIPPLVSDALFMTEGRSLAFEGNAPPTVVPLNPQQPFGADRTGPATPLFFVAVDRDCLDRIALETFDLDLIRFEPGRELPRRAQDRRFSGILELGLSLVRESVEAF